MFTSCKNNSRRPTALTTVYTVQLHMTILPQSNFAIRLSTSPIEMLCPHNVFCFLELELCDTDYCEFPNTRQGLRLHVLVAVFFFSM